ncbi:hypothetical protein D3C72_2129430 [compost metagenome]
MLVEQGFDIGVGRFGRRFAAAHGGDANGCAAMIVRVDGQNLFIGLHRRVNIAGFLKRERAVIGFGKRLFVNFLVLRHRAVSVSIFS